MHNTRTFTPTHAHTHPRSATRPARRAKRVSPYTILAKKIFKRVKVHLCVYVAFFFLLPSVLSSGADNILLTLVYPVISFLLTTLYGYRYGFIKHYLAVPIMLFTVASFFHFASFSFLYGFCYLLIGIVALAFGTHARKVFR